MGLVGLEEERELIWESRIVEIGAVVGNGAAGAACMSRHPYWPIRVSLATQLNTPTALEFSGRTIDAKRE